MKINFNAEKISSAIEMLLRGAASKVDVDRQTKVYLCKNIVRIDIKIPSEGEGN